MEKEVKDEPMEVPVPTTVEAPKSAEPEAVPKVEAQPELKTEVTEPRVSSSPAVAMEVAPVASPVHMEDPPDDIVTPGAAALAAAVARDAAPSAPVVRGMLHPHMHHGHGPPPHPMMRHAGPSGLPHPAMHAHAIPPGYMAAEGMPPGEIGSNLLNVFDQNVLADLSDLSQ